jgi:hypothetical protein
MIAASVIGKNQVTANRQAEAAHGADPLYLEGADARSSNM